MIGVMVEDVLLQTRDNLEEIKPESPEDVRVCGRPVVAFSLQMREDVQKMRDFLFSRM